MFGSRTARLAQLLALTLALLVLLPGLALGDNLQSDGDGLTPVSDSNLNFGTVCRGVATSRTVLIAANRNGDAGGPNVYKDGSAVSVTGSTGSAGLTITDPASTIAIPSDWSTKANNTKSPAVSATVTLTAPSTPSFSGSITWSGTGVNSDDDALIRTDGMSVSATVTTCDTTPPNTTIDSAPSSPTASTSAAFTYSSSESGSTFECKLDSGAFASCPAAGTNYSSLGEGSHTVQVRATDGAGNTDPSPASHTWIIDLTAPDTTIVTAPPALTNSTDADFTYTSSESGSTFACKLDTGDYASCPAAGKSYSGLGEGSHTFSVKATDAAGNTDAEAATYTWTIDLTPPAVSMPDLTDPSDTGVSQIDNFTKDATPGFTGTAEDGATVELLRDDVVVDSATATGGVWSFTSEALAEGTYSFTARATDAAGNQATSTLLSVLIDLTNPSIEEASRLPAANDYGWNNSAVTVTWTCSDLLSGVVDTTDSDTVLGQGAGQSASGSCSDIAGNTASATHDDINIDLTAPEASATATSNGSPYAAGTWTKYDVVVTYGCTDGLSGVGSIDTPDTLGEGEDQSATGTCTDKAGNSDDATFSDIDVDKTAPVATASAKTADDVAYVGGTWTNQSVTVTFDCTDALSGVLSLSPASTTLSGHGANQSAGSTCTDNAGNTHATSFENIDIDKVAPGIAFASRLPAANGNGWNNSAVTVTWNCSDADSGPASGTVSDTKSGEGADQTASGTCQDNAGNTAGASVGNIDIDLTDPYGIAWTGGPADGASYYFGSVPAAPTCSAFDDVSGLASCTVTGYSSGIGSHTMTATAVDVAGNDATVTRSYTVLAWNLGGFYSPVDMHGVWNTVKGGSTVPLKWEMFTDVEITDPAAITSITATPVSCLGGTADAIEVTSTGGTTSPRYDWTAGQFIYNWQTPKKPGACYQLTMAAGGTSISALFKLK